jgi:hypothetical protein
MTETASWPAQLDDVIDELARIRAVLEERGRRAFDPVKPGGAPAPRRRGGHDIGKGRQCRP